MNKQNYRGSEWRKWDLHMHSFGTKMNNQFGDDVDAYLQKIEDSDVAVFGITDYFNVNTQFETINQFKSKFPDSNKVFFVNVEFRLNENVSDDPAGHVNVHLIFDNRLSESKVKSFVESLELTQTTKYGTHKKITELQTEQDYQSATIDRHEISKKLSENFGSEKPYLIVFAAGGHGGIRPNIEKGKVNGSLRNGPLSDELDKMSDFLFGDVQSKDYFLNRRMEADGTFKQAVRYEDADKKAIVKESDAHMLEKSGETNGIGDGYSWIKADTTFEGLRQILFEPENRVAISQEYPELKSPYLVIDHVTFNQKVKGQDKSISVFLNPNLNTIIGGRSNGKSTLTNTLAKTLKNPLFEERDEATGQWMHTFNDSDFKVYWQDKNEPDATRDIEFIPQDYMIKLAENDDDRNALIRSTIKTDENNYQNILDYEKKVLENQPSIHKLIEEWETLNNRLSELEAPEGDKSGIERQLSSLNDAIKDQSAKVNFSVEEQEEYQQAYSNWQNFENKYRLTKGNLRNILARKNEKISLNVNVPQSDDNDYNNELSVFIKELEREVNEKWQTKLRELEEKQTQKLSEYKQSADKVLCSEEYVNGKSNIEKSQILESLSEQQKIEKAKLEAFQKFESDKHDLQRQKSEKENQILEQYSKFKKFQDDLKDSFKAKPNNGNIEITIDFSDVSFEDKISYLRSNNVSNMQFIQEFKNNRDETVSNIFKRENLVFNQGKKFDEFIRDLFSQNWTTLNYILKYENDDFSKMSQGKKAFVILTLILEFSQDKKPVIIDQPEDSLDNRSIYQELTRYLKTKKKERQIILVTHNPNVVVGADSENVIVANQHSLNEPNEDEIQFSYVNGALENTFIDNSATAVLNKKGIREHVVEILEGGKEAFKKREDKYTSEVSL